MELSDYLKIARRWWWTLVVAAWFGGLAGYFVSSRISPTFESRASVLVGPVNTDTDTLRASGQLVQTYAALATSRPTLDSVISRLGLEMTPDDLRPIVRPVANDITRIVTIRVQDASPERAADIANTIAETLRELAQRGGVRPQGTVEIIESGVADPVPVAPNITLLVLLAAFAGLVAALAVVMLIESFNRTVRDQEDVRRKELPFLGVARTHAAAADDRATAVAADPLSVAAGDYRTIAGKLAYDDRQPLAKSLLVVGVDDGDGAAYVAANLATTLARGGRSVVLVDADWIQRDVSAMFGLDRQRGLREALGGEIAFSLAPHPTEITGLSVVPAGLGDPPEVIDRAAAFRVLETLLRDADHVIAAAPAVRTSAATLGWAHALDHVVLTVERHRVKREEIDELMDGLVFVGATVIGWVLTDSRTPGRKSGAGDRRAVRERPAEPRPSGPLAPHPGRVGGEQPSHPGGGSGS